MDSNFYRYLLDYQSEDDMDDLEAIVSEEHPEGHAGGLDITTVAAVEGSPPSAKGADQIQIGFVETPKSTADKYWDLKVSFSPSYRQPPTLVPIFKKFDVGNSADAWTFRAYTEALAVSSDRATVRVGTWADTKMYSAAVAWMAIPASNYKLQTGLISIPSGGDNTHIHFPKRFSSQPQVFCTVHRMDISNNWRIDLNVNTITADGFDIEVHSWGSGILHGAGITWIAFPGHTPETGVYTVHPVEEQKGSKGYIAFTEAYSMVPQVFVGLSKMDISAGHNGRLELSVSNVTNKGMHWEIITWADTLLYELRVTFLVLGNIS